MKNIFKGFTDRVHRKCDALSQQQRKRVVAILSAIYLLLTALVIASVFILDGDGKEKGDFNNLMDGIQRDSLAMPNLTGGETEHLNGKDYE